MILVHFEFFGTDKELEEVYNVWKDMANASEGVELVGRFTPNQGRYHCTYLIKADSLAAWEKGYDLVLRNAPILIVASAPKDAINGMVDLTLALGYLDLAAPTLGLGTCWAGLLQSALLSSPPLKEALGIPLDHPYHYGMMLGYPKVKYHRLPERKQPKITWG